MNKLFVVALFAVLSVWLVPVAASADPVDNPQFAAWSKCGVGTTVSYTQTEDYSGKSMVLDVTKTLKDKADDHLTLDVTTELKAAGVPPQNRSETVKAKLDKQPDLKSLPNEQIQVGDKKFDCKVSEIDTKDPKGQDVKVQIWTNDDVPGGLVKMRATIATANGQATHTLELESFDKR